MSERALVTRALKALRALPHTFAIKLHGSVYARAGEPDVIGCCNGTLFVIEFKSSAGRITPLQEIRLKQWAAAGARAGVARSVESALAIARGEE